VIKERDEIYPIFSLHETKAGSAIIKMEWIEETIKHPAHTEVQADGRIRKWKKIEGAGKILRVILLPDGETVHNAFFLGIKPIKL